MNMYPTRYIVFDTETNETAVEGPKPIKVLQFRLGVAKVYDPAHGEGGTPHYCHFTDTDTFHTLIRDMPLSKEPIYIFAHNAGFDIRIIKMFDYMTLGWYHLWSPTAPAGSRTHRDPFVVMENPPLIIEVYRPDGQKIVWLDTYQWIAHPLRKVGEILGYPKGEMPPLSAPDADWFPYCQQDVDVLDHALHNIWDWLKLNKIQRFAPTRASQAMQIYRQRYEKNRILRHDNKAASDLERHAYYGGRTDLFFVGEVKGPIHQIDVNSLYPAVMYKNWYPCELIAQVNTLNNAWIMSEQLAKSCTAEVWLDSPVNSYPVRCTDGTWFCRGKVHTVLSGPELSRAIREGDVVRMGRINRYRMARLFDAFIDDFWRMRLGAQARDDDVANWIIKLLMNSLYGKFGQLTGEWVYDHDSQQSGYYGQGYVARGDSQEETDWRALDGHIFHRVQRTEAKYAFIAIASFVTAYARVLMDRHREHLGTSNLYYQATDSLYVNDQSLERLKAAGEIEGKTLGKFKVEATYNTCTFRNIHNLDKDDKRVRGSVKPKAVEISPNLYQTENWESFTASIYRNTTNKVVITEVKKMLNPRYLRQRVLPNGETTPWVIDNWHLSIDEQKRLRVPKVR